MTAETYRIVCVTTAIVEGAKHSHITGVGTGKDPDQSDKGWYVNQVRDALDLGDVFYTVSPSTKDVAVVSKLDCSCGYKTIRSNSDPAKDNNLDNLRECRP